MTAEDGQEVVARKHFQGPGFVMHVPTDWFVSSTPQFQALFISPQDEAGSRGNLSVSMRPLEEDVTAHAVAETTRQSQADAYTDYEVLDEIDFTEQGGAGLMRRYRWYDANQDAVIGQMQAFFVVGQMLFTLTATAREAQFAHYQPLFEDMVESFRITGSVE